MFPLQPLKHNAPGSHWLLKILIVRQEQWGNVCHLSTLKAEAGGTHEFEASLGYFIRSVSINKMKQNKRNILLFDLFAEINLTQTSSLLGERQSPSPVSYLSDHLLSWLPQGTSASNPWILPRFMYCSQ